jgi:hypothetical protein
VTKTLSGYGSCEGAPVPSSPPTTIVFSPIEFFEVPEDFWGCESLSDLLDRHLLAVPVRWLRLENLLCLGPPNGSPEVLREGDGGCVENESGD